MLVSRPVRSIPSASSLFPFTSALTVAGIFSNAANTRLPTKARSKGGTGSGRVGRGTAWVGSWIGIGTERGTDAGPGADSGAGVGADKAEVGAETAGAVAAHPQTAAATIIFC